MLSTKIGPDGRILIPVELRRALGFDPGDRLVAHADDGRLVIERPEQVLARLRSRFATLGSDVRLADELIEERRREAERDRA
jgi:AbrB family looped-hinge helix DNA binding protein